MEFRWAADAFESFLRKISQVTLVHHTDADGASAAVLFMNAAQAYRVPVVKTLSPPLNPYISKDVYEGILLAGAEGVAVVDLPIHADMTYVDELARSYTCLCIDHHGDEACPPVDLNKHGMTHLHSYLLGAEVPSKYPAGKLTYDLLDALDMGMGLSWLAGVSIIGDMATDEWPGFFKQNRLDYEKLQWIAETFNLSLHTPDENRLCFEKLAKAESPETVLDDSEFVRVHEELKDEMYWLVDDFETNHERVNDRLVYPVESAFILNYPVSNAVSSKHPKDMLLVYQKVPGGYRVEARNRAGNLHAGELMRGLCQGIGGGGGHRIAGGGFVEDKSYQTFLERLRTI